MRLGVIRPGLYAMQVRALVEAAVEREAGKNPIVIMIPLTVTREEWRWLAPGSKGAIAETARVCATSRRSRSAR
ncbi:MAG: hypothetical protein R2705_24650 [Ilumatobacteraceae bacterium]